MNIANNFGGGDKKKCCRESETKCTDKIKFYGSSDGGRRKKKSYMTFPKLNTKFDQYSINSAEPWASFDSEGHGKHV